MDYEEKEKRDRKREELAVRYVMQTEQGREFVWSLLSRFGLYRSAPVIDPTHIAVNEGRRQAALQLLGLVTDHAELEVLTMQREARNRAKLEEHEDGKDRKYRDDSDGRDGSDGISELDGIVGGYFAESGEGAGGF